MNKDRKLPPQKIQVERRHLPAPSEADGSARKTETTAKGTCAKKNVAKGQKETRILSIFFPEWSL